MLYKISPCLELMAQNKVVIPTPSNIRSIKTSSIRKHLEQAIEVHLPTRDEENIGYEFTEPWNNLRVRAISPITVYSQDYLLTADRVHIRRQPAAPISRTSVPGVQPKTTLNGLSFLFCLE